MISSPNMAEKLALAHQHWSTRSGASVHPAPFTITISRQAGTYGAAIARALGDRLGWPVYDCELLQRLADDMGLHRSLLDSVDERQESWLAECFKRLFSVPEVDQTAYFHRLLEILLSLGSHGQCVIVGRGASHVLPAATTLRVRVVAPLEHRIAAVRREHGISAEEARARVEKTDRDRDKFVTHHFQIDPANPLNYDLVLNAARFSTAEGADIILRALDHLRDGAETYRPSLTQAAAAT